MVLRAGVADLHCWGWARTGSGRLSASMSLTMEKVTRAEISAPPDRQRAIRPA